MKTWALITVAFVAVQSYSAMASECEDLLAGRPTSSPVEVGFRYLNSDGLPDSQDLIRVDLTRTDDTFHMCYSELEGYWAGAGDTGGDTYDHKLVFQRQLSGPISIEADSGVIHLGNVAVLLPKKFASGLYYVLRFKRVVHDPRIFRASQISGNFRF